MPIEQPQVLVSVGGVVTPGVVSLELVSVGYAAADRFCVGFALGGAMGGAAFYAGLGGQPITISVSSAGFGFAPMLVGRVDHVRIDLGQNLAALSGRDLTALMIDAEIADAYVNQTASQIATAIAERHGLTPVVTATTDFVGQYYERDHARAALGLNARATTEWNLLIALAQAEAFEVDVVGQSLMFGPAAAAVPVEVTAQNFSQLDVDYAASLPGSAVVRSWSARNKAVNQASVGSGAVTSLVRPNLSAAQTQMAAATHLNALSAHALFLTGTMPGEVVLRPGSTLQLSGTKSVFDTGYTVISISRGVTAAHGFRQTVRGYAPAA